jgi:hypothetical protein
VSISEVDELIVSRQRSDSLTASTRLSVLSPLLGSSLADLKEFRTGSIYQSISGELDAA